MERFIHKLFTPRAARVRTCYHTLAVFMFALLASVFVSAQVRTPSQPQRQQQQEAGARKDSPFEDETDAEVEEESESVPRAVARARVTDPATILRRALRLRGHGQLLRQAAGG